MRLAGFGGATVPWGVKWGGAEQCRFLKNLLLQPVPNGPGLRLSTASTDLLRLGLQLDRDLEKHVRHPSLPVRQQLRLPCLWAGFKPSDAATNHRRRAGTGGILPSHGQVGRAIVEGSDATTSAFRSTRFHG